MYHTYVLDATVIAQTYGLSFF